MIKPTQLQSGLFLILCVSLLVSGCMRITDSNGKQLKLQKDVGGYYVAAAGTAIEAKPTGKHLSANVKGSIYETGEIMTVFGTCLDSDDQDVGAVALFSAWYPNATQFLSNYSMSPVIGSPGYFAYRGAMQNVEGTYLTQMTCIANISGTEYRAHALGEWQNPFWVKRIALLNESINSMNLSLTNLLDRKYTLYFRNVSSDIGGFLAMNSSVPTTPQVNEDFVGVTNNQLLYSFMSGPVGSFNLITRGEIFSNIHALQYGGTKSAYLYTVISARKANASETVICTTGLSSLIVANLTEAGMSCDVPMDWPLDSTDRIVARIYVSTPGGGSPPDLRFQYDDQMGCGIDLPSSYDLDLTKVNQKLDNITILIGNLSVDMGEGFNITWAKIDQLNASLNASTYALNQSIYYAAGVANASVDRNDSYLAMLIHNLTITIFQNMTNIVYPQGSLNYTYTETDVTYRKQWSITVQATSQLENNKIVQYPDATCQIVTSLTPGPTTMTPQGSHFIYSELITTLNAFTWNVTCSYT